MKNLVCIIFMVLLLFLFVGQPAISGPPPPDWNRINDPLHETPWDELSNNQTPQRTIYEKTTITACETNPAALTQMAEPLCSVKIFVLMNRVLVIDVNYKSLDDVEITKKEIRLHRQAYSE